MNLLLCDDQSEFIKEFTKQLEGYFLSRQVSFQLFVFSKGEDLLKADISPDIIFLDIKMGGLSGIETARILRNNQIRSKIIFLTAYKQYVFDAFDVDASHYLIKPVKEKKLEAVLDHVMEQLTSAKTQFLTIQSGSCIQRFSYSDILYLEVRNRKVTVHSQTGNVDFYGKLDTLEKCLPTHFFRCHRSFIVNMDFVMQISKTDLLITNGELIPVSKRKYQDFSIAFMKQMQKEGLS
ncbi:LytR/AlgR family response regulator transcription factor [Lacrimispora algidixylanolytica]|uniref:Stage 0 sporulation protein A homolog n=1 Tax=Lacrimispora algidixylanolytica TaxID=94868 RepID=A0A419T8U4_9FIRM|nr:LytTR family DNA-binding domain-containing protein [Lacrimispora algidixylanolytica]RKD33828.1 hypothetical protein BET01_13225 [Lacrimispora algidixylanolytica]